MKLRPVAQRDTNVRSLREIATRLTYLVYLLALPAGGVCLLWGATQGKTPALGAAAAFVLLFASLHRFARHPLEFALMRAELKNNPFKRKTVGEDVGATPATSTNACKQGSCGLI